MEDWEKVLITYTAVKNPLQSRKENPKSQANLQPLTREIRQKGAETTHQIIRGKKMLKELLISNLQKVDEETGKTHAELLTEALIAKGERTGNHEVFGTIRDTIGEKPKDEIVQKVETIDIKVQDEEQ